MTNQLEQIISEWLEFIKKYVVRRNVKVGRRNRKGEDHGGGYEGELDIVAYDPAKKRILHVESAIMSKTEREVDRRFEKKFSKGRKYIRREVFPWVSKSAPIEQWAVIMGSCARSKKLGGCEVWRAERIYNEIANDLRQRAKEEGGWKVGIPENYPLLRTMHHTLRWVERGGLRRAED